MPPEKIPNFVPPPLEELCVGVVDDGSPLAKAAIAVSRLFRARDMHAVSVTRV